MTAAGAIANSKRLINWTKRRRTYQGALSRYDSRKRFTFNFLNFKSDVAYGLVVFMSFTWFESFITNDSLQAFTLDFSPDLYS